MTITAPMVKDLRSKSGAGIMECKEALNESAGDIEAALDFLRKKGAAKAAKKADRSTKEGSIAGLLSDKKASLVELKCETDFVAMNEKFKAFTTKLAEQTLKNGEGSDEADFSGQAFIDDESKTVNDAITEAIHEIGENIVIGRRVRYELVGAGVFGLYIHAGDSIGALVELGCEKVATSTNDKFVALAKDMGMQIAAVPTTIAITPGDLPQEVIDHEKSIFEGQAKESGKPEKIIPKIVEGMTKKFFKEACLIEQAFVKDTDKNIGALLAELGKELGDEITIRRFSRFQLGE